MLQKVNKQITVIIGLVVRNSKILMVKRHEPEVKGAHLKWEFPGGKIDFGETPEEAIIREIKEETGVFVSVKRFLPCNVVTNWEYPWGTQQTLIFGYECEFISVEKPKFDHHVKDVQWVALNEVLKRENLPGPRLFLNSLNS